MVLPNDRLTQARQALGEKLAERLADPQASLSELRELDERARLLNAAIAAQQAPRRRRLGAVLWPFAAVALLLLVAATLRWPSVPLSLELRASSITARLGEPTTLEGQALEGSELRLEGFTAAELGPGLLAVSPAVEHIDPVSVQSEQTWLRGIALPGAADVTLQLRGERLVLAVESLSSPVVANVELRGRTSLRLGDAPAPAPTQLAKAEWLRLVAGSAASAQQRAPPVELSWSVAGAAAPRFVELAPLALRFAERRAAAGVGVTSRLRSGIEGGQLTLAATNQTIPIAAGEWLDIDGLVTERCEIVVADGALTLKLNGSARDLKLRVGSLERSLKPTWLEYLSRHHLATLLWSSAVALWGAVAWTRRQFAEVSA